MEAIRTIIHAAFPEHPVPVHFFLHSEVLHLDMPQELATRIEGRAWTSLALLEWRMVGSTPAAYREYLAPQTFAYYVPSFLAGAIAQPAFRDLALEAILPNNRRQSPRGEWWASFAVAFSVPQRKAIKAFIAFQKTTAVKSADAVDEALVGAAEVVWA
jgi:hypothetical protein